MGQIRRDLPNDEYQAAIGANNASASNVFATIADLTSSDIPHAVASGTNTYTTTITGVTAYTDGDAYLIRFTNGSDADSTININGLGAKTLTKQPGVQVTGGDILAGQEMVLIYDGTNFQCIGVTPNQLFAYVTNDDSVAILKGQPVYAFGAAGNRMSVKLASNSSDATSAQTIGVVYSSSIAPNQRGFIITQGVVSGVNTAAYSAGNQLYLGVAAGSLTNVKPYAPNHLVYIGIVERANAGNGQIYVKPQNGYELDELHDVDLITTPPTDGQVLTYDSITGLWKNESIYNQTVQEEGVSLPQRPTINITGAGVSAIDDALNNKTIINIPGSIGSTVYYLNETVAQAPYKEFSSVPTAAAEQTISTAVGVGSTVTIQSFQTPSGVPNTTNIPSGLWQFYLHFSGTAGDSWDVYAEVYKRDLGGIETLLLTTDVIPTTALSAIPTMILTDGVFAAATLLTTDRIVVKVKVTNTGAAGQTITFHTEGSTNYSVGTTTLNQVITAGSVTSVTGTAPITSSGGSTPAIGIPQATALVDGYLDSVDWSTFNGKQDAITLTTVGSSGAATFIANTFNIPNYTLAGLGGVPISRTITINGVVFDLSANRSWSVGTVTSVGLSAGTGISVGGTNPVTGSGTIIVTNTAPDQIVILTPSTGINVTGTYPNFTITNTAPDQVVSLTAGTGISITGTYPNFTINNTVSDTNIYNTDGTFTGNRTATFTGNRVLFTGVNGITTIELDLKAAAGSGNRYGKLSSTAGTITNFLSVSGSSAALSGTDSSTSETGSVSANSTEAVLSHTNGINLYDITANSAGLRVNNAFYLPTNGGTANQVLTSNGAGVASWQTPSVTPSTWNVTTQAGASYTAASNDYVLVNAATHTVTLPAAANGIRVGVKMINATVTNIQVKTPSAGVTIDGTNRFVTGLPILNQYDAYTFVCDGTNWWIMG